MSHIYTQCVNFCDVASKVGNRYSITIMICRGISPRYINHNHSVFIWQAGATRNFRFWCQDGWIQLGDPLSDFVGRGDEHGSASVYRASTLVKATEGLTHGETEASVIPPVGTFICLDEGYEFYNVYSLEYGFGVRCGASSMDSHGTKCI